MAHGAGARRRQRRIIGNLIYALALFAVLFFMLMPFLWMVLNAFKTPLQIIKLPPELIFEPTMRNFQNVFGTQNFMRYITNSLIIAASCTLVGLLIGLPAAYSIARFRQNRLALVILMARMVPGITFLVPLFIVFRTLGMIDTYTSLILTHMLVGLPFIVWVMVPFFESIPRELTEAAVVDGASALRAFVTVVLPLSGPGIVTASILSFVFSWNNFMFSIVLASSRTRTVPVAIYNFISYAQIDWGGLMAAAVVITLPVLALAIVTQRYVIRGLTAGAIKG
ncbi:MULTISPECIES: carbohydrate ABC transporter permease [Caldilinea]|jgi:multiple sugar transport system permease protein|uniref:Putative ABC transporter permease protein n=1 Tax=Caldilinea aerophila (strain DSM 14535 / JCM 11387 / NBRC 104270 / STL-6-O1) TaxID=926550 RepID=I0I921_CALAS|nr:MULTISPECIES: carbohydrate ABC transporter permease [Caldilinea]BAM01759.1 putative ABC transporter permease protein [Caldilinea aerophila DSM 14535 = NBRC 104270]GIV73094.1 MAG: sugar ABC transporter permease [Caldilinea sp.]